jgi:hypothetical protein
MPRVSTDKTDKTPFVGFVGVLFSFTMSMYDTIIDDLERDFGIAILESLTSEPLRKKGQKVRLFDNTRNSAEVYYPSDKRGKPSIYNHQTNEYWYPIKAYAKVYNIDFKTAVADLYRQYHGINIHKEGGTKIKSQSNVYRSRVQPTPAPVPKVSYLPIDLYKPCQTLFERNGFYEYLRYTFSRRTNPEIGRLLTDAAFARYRLGTSNHWRYLGYLATTLPQFDIAGNLRQVKVIIFDAMNGRRIKNGQEAECWDRTEKRFKVDEFNKDKIYFAGKEIARQAGMTDVRLQQSLFGEHLLNEYPNKKVALVEGESTAIVCSIVMPEYLWLATGGSSGAGWTKPGVFGVLKGRDVALWPDTGKFTEWQQKAESLRPLVRSLYVSDYVQQRALEGENNIDLRDILMRPYYRPTDGSGLIFGEVLR